ncbi:DsbA family protein [Streptomyces sp. NPDC051020]|uniref:mycothiol-dependent nitroreductase Rv2466c family protein n=1 Tax=Streptomyces sp. NPDC051020 TaxID=3155409 RepID=UPI0034245450
MTDTATPTRATPTRVDLWADPVCPWTWLTSRWLLEVRRQRPIEITWHVMSLAVLNEQRLDELAPHIRELMGQAWAPVRVMIAAEKMFGQQALEPLYEALATRYHPGQAPKGRATIQAALRDASLPENLADAGDTDAHDEDLRTSHAAGIDLVGSEVGSPVIAVPGPGGTTAKTAFFGPVVTPAPKGADAVQLWDGALAVAATPGFYEIKRGRNVGPIFD